MNSLGKNTCINAKTGGTKMNTIWSENVQGIMTLYLSRRLRFNDLFFKEYKVMSQG